jgi:hypothetical protein
MPVLASYRWRRRLLWGGFALVGVLGLVVAALALPRSSGRHYSLTATGSAAPVTVAEPTQVKLAPADRRAIDDTVDAFVHSGVDRSNPAAAWDLVTPAMRSATTRAEWDKGSLPVVPFPAKPQRAGWTVLTSYPRDVTIDLLLHSTAKAHRGAIAFAVDLKKEQGRWLVDSMVPEQVFGPSGGARTSTLSAAQKRSVGDKPVLSPVWFIIPGALLALIVLVPLVILIRTWLRHRAIERRYREGRL